MKLTHKQELFCNHYLETTNATEAAKRAGYSEKTAYAIGHELLKNPKIDQYITLRMNERKEKAILSADEVLQLLTKMALGEVVETIPVGMGGGVQVLKENKTNNKDRLKALELLGKRHTLFTDKSSVELNGEVGVKIVDDIE